MKILCVAFVLTLISSSQQGFTGLGKEAHAIIGECISESNADAGMVKDFVDNGNISADSNFKCFLNCFSSSITLLKPSGDIDSDVLKTILSEFGVKPDVIDEVLANCGEPTGDDGCEIAYNLVDCINKSVS